MIAPDGTSLHADHPRWQACDHPCYDVAKGERLLKDVYEALRAWTSLIALKLPAHRPLIAFSSPSDCQTIERSLRMLS